MSVKTHLSATVQYIAFERYEISVSDITFSLYECNLNGPDSSDVAKIPSVSLMYLARAE